MGFLKIYIFFDKEFSEGYPPGAGRKVGLCKGIGRKFFGYRTGGKPSAKNSLLEVFKGLFAFPTPKDKTSNNGSLSEGGKNKGFWLPRLSADFSFFQNKGALGGSLWGKGLNTWK